MKKVCVGKNQRAQSRETEHPSFRVAIDLEQCYAMQARGTDLESRAGGGLVLPWRSMPMDCPSPSRVPHQLNFVSAKMPSHRFRSPNSLLANAHPCKDRRRRKDQNNVLPHESLKRTLFLCRPEWKQYLAARCRIHPPTTPITNHTAVVVRRRLQPSSFPRAHLR